MFVTCLSSSSIAFQNLAKKTVHNAWFGAQQDGMLSYAWKLNPTLAGGDYKIRVSFPRYRLMIPMAEREIRLQAISVPRMNMVIEFEQKAYGAGDRAKASVDVTQVFTHSLFLLLLSHPSPSLSPLSPTTSSFSLHPHEHVFFLFSCHAAIFLQATGDIPRFAKVSFIANIDGDEVHRNDTKLDADGSAAVEFIVPEGMARGVGSLTVVVTYKGKQDFSLLPFLSLWPLFALLIHYTHKLKNGREMYGRSEEIQSGVVQGVRRACMLVQYYFMQKLTVTT